MSTATATATATVPVLASLVNAVDGNGNVYRTTDPAYNKITMKVTNNLAVPITFPPGQPVDFGDLPSTASAVYLFFGGLLANAEIKAMSLSASGWASGTFVDDGFQYLVAAPAAQVTLPAGGNLEFELEHVVVSEQPTSGYGTVDLAGATTSDQTADLTDVPLFINVANQSQPGGGSLLTALDIGFDDAMVYAGQPAELVLHLVNHKIDVLVPGGKTSWGSNPPTFRFQPVYGSGPGALTKVWEADDIEARISDARGNHWKPVQAHTQGALPSWVMQPDPNCGGDVIGTGNDAVIEFAFSQITSHVPAGFDRALSVVYVSWSGVPGYDDDAVGLTVTKLQGPSITTFRADPSTIPFNEQTVRTTLVWATQYADHVTFSGVACVGPQWFDPSGSGPLGGGIVAKRHGAMTLNAVRDDAGDGQRTPAPKPPTADVDAPATARHSTVSAQLTVPGVDRVDVPLGFAGGMALAAPPGQRVAYVGTVSSSAIAVVNLATRTLTRTIDLATLVGSIAPTATYAAACGADGLIYFVAGRTTGTDRPWIVPFHTASGTAGTPVSLARQGPPPLMANVVIGPGTLLYACTMGQVKDEYLAPIELVVVDTSTASVTKRFPWSSIALPPKAGWVAGVTADGSGVITCSQTALHVVSVEAQLQIRATLDLAAAKLTGLRTPSLSPDGLTMWLPALDENTVDEQAQTAEVVLLKIALDASGSSMSIATRIQLARTTSLIVAYTDPMTMLGFGSWVTSAPDGSHVYVALPPLMIAAVDVVSSHVELWTCGESQPGVGLWAGAMALDAQSSSVFALSQGDLAAVSVDRS